MPAPMSKLAQGSAALKQALQALMAPLARLCVARGLTFGEAQDLLKRAYVDAAREVQGGAPGLRDVSRVSTVTGLTRREVNRITSEVAAPTGVRLSPPIQVVTKWLSNRRLRDKDGRAKVLKRQGRSPSFEALASSVTRDVHPRSLLDELCRLGLVRHDEVNDTVALLHDSFVPVNDQASMLDFLGSNVGDHLAASVANVIAAEAPHLEQAIFAEELSAESLARVRELVSAQWKSMLTTLAPQLELLIEADQRAGREASHRVRVGLYSYHAPMPNSIDDSRDN
ncbi:MAG: DUF6502 family protein [Burkholderiaceae bacterium]